jgi:hypothetical protein
MRPIIAAPILIALSNACSNSKEGGDAGAASDTTGVGGGSTSDGSNAVSTTNSDGSGGASTTGGVPCSAAQYTHTFEFGAIFEGWGISSYSTSHLIPGIDVGAGGAGGEGGDAGQGSGTRIELDTSEGAPGSPEGSLELVVPFDGPAQLLLLEHVFSTGMNFEGTLVTAQIKLDSGLIVGPSDTGTANLVLKATDSFVYHPGPRVVLDPSAGWVTLSIDPDTPTTDAAAAGYTACQIREIDIEIHTGDTGNYQQAVVHVDSIAVTPKDQ